VNADNAEVSYYCEELQARGDTFARKVRSARPQSVTFLASQGHAIRRLEYTQLSFTQECRTQKDVRLRRQAIQIVNWCLRTCHRASAVSWNTTKLPRQYRARNQIMTSVKAYFRLFCGCIAVCDLSLLHLRCSRIDGSLIAVAIDKLGISKLAGECSDSSAATEQKKAK
jgi:hypothetical protein